MINMYMNTITDVAEVGYLKHPGGSVKISIIFDRQLKKFEKKAILKVIDLLDHTTLTDNSKVENFSDRYIIIEEGSENFSKDVLLTISTFLENLPLLKTLISFVSIDINDDILTTDFRALVESNQDFSISLSPEIEKDTINIMKKLEKKYANEN